MARVVLGGLNPIIERGIRDLLVGHGMEVIVGNADDPAHEADLIGRMEPDVVIVDLDCSGGAERATRIAVDLPRVKVIACSSATPAMRVYPPHHNGESYVAQLDPRTFLTAVRGPE